MRKDNPNEFDELIPDFLIESRENLDRLDQDFVALEHSPSDRDRLDSIFRTLHTIKGTCGYLNFSKLGALTHAGEALLSRLRDGSLTLTEEITSALLKTVDAVRHMLSTIEAQHNDGDNDYAELIATLHRLESGQAVSAISDPTPVASAEEITPEATSATTLRVPIDLLDRLMTLAGELVLARNHLVKRAAGDTGAEFTATLQRLNLVTSDLQETVTKTRMQPVAVLWQKLPRVVRDLALECGKKVRLEMSGGDTDLDKALLEAVKDPLLHAVRNAVDHGIETPEERATRGKPAEGTLRLRAFHEAGNVVIEMEDDGRGIDLENVKRKALERGLVSAEQAAQLNERDTLALIFRPGFSTTSTVTSISGRGVGMDVIKRNIEGIGGSVAMVNKPGFGTTLRMRIPLTLAILPALIVASRGERYALPQSSVIELFRLDAKTHPIEDLLGSVVVRLRELLLPLIFLEREFFGTSPALEGTVVVMQVNDQHFGLVVDATLESEEVVVKPLHPLLKTLPVFAGATLMGDGRVALILSPQGLAEHAHLAHADVNASASTVEPDIQPSKDRQSFLLCEAPAGRRLAIPLSEVTRLEEFPASAIETSGDQSVLLYRGQIMPLLRLDALSVAPEADVRLPIVVHGRDDQRIGLVVSRIVDIIDRPLILQREGLHPTLLGTAEIQGRITDVLNVAAVTASLKTGGIAQGLAA